MVKKFCVKCGSLESKENPIVESLCLKCYLEVKELVQLPKSYSITRCPKCGNVRVSGKWIESSGSLEDDISFLLRNFLAVKPASEVFTGYEVNPIDFIYGKGILKAVISVKAEYMGKVLRKNYIIDIIIKNKLCPRCFALSGGGFEALVQFRSSRKPDKDFINFIFKTLKDIPYDITSSITEIENLKEGINVKLMNHTAARKLATFYQKRYCAKVIESRKKVGIDRSGRSKFKLTFSVRIPEIIFKKLQLYKGRPILLKESGNSSVYLIDLKTGELLKFKSSELWRDIKNFNTISNDMIKTLRVLNIKGNRVELLDEENQARVYSSIVLLKFFTNIKTNSYVKALIINEKAYLIPEEF